jgi:hypothetical protein
LLLGHVVARSSKARTTQLCMSIRWSSIEMIQKFENV